MKSVITNYLVQWYSSRALSSSLSTPSGLRSQHYFFISFYDHLFALYWNSRLLWPSCLGVPYIWDIVPWYCIQVFLHCTRIALLVIVFSAGRFIFLSAIYIFVICFVLFEGSGWDLSVGCYADHSGLKLKILLSQPPHQPSKCWDYTWASLLLAVDNIRLCCSEMIHLMVIILHVTWWLLFLLLLWDFDTMNKMYHGTDLIKVNPTVFY